ncbi:MAG: ester cyclase [Solirubrobacterales bacterium]
MSAEENRELVERFYEEVVNERRLETIDELLTEDFVHNGEQRGREGQRRTYEAFFAGFPDLRSEVVEIVACGSAVAVHRRWTGTHEGAFQGVEPTGRRVEFESTAILTVRDGRISGYRGVVDLLGLMEQLGAAPPVSF